MDISIQITEYLELLLGKPKASVSRPGSQAECYELFRFSLECIMQWTPEMSKANICIEVAKKLRWDVLIKLLRTYDASPLIGHDEHTAFNYSNIDLQYIICGCYPRLYNYDYGLSAVQKQRNVMIYKANTQQLGRPLMHESRVDADIIPPIGDPRRGQVLASLLNDVVQRYVLPIVQAEPSGFGTDYDLYRFFSDRPKVRAVFTEALLFHALNKQNSIYNLFCRYAKDCGIRPVHAYEVIFKVNNLIG